MQCNKPYIMTTMHGIVFLSYYIGDFARNWINNRGKWYQIDKKVMWNDATLVIINL